MELPYTAIPYVLYSKIEYILIIKDKRLFEFKKFVESMCV